MKKLALIMSVMVCLLCFVGCNNNDVVVNGEENNNQQEEQNPNVEEPSVGDGALDIPSEELKPEEPKDEEPKEDNKVEEPKDEEPKEDNKVEEPKDEEPKEDNTDVPANDDKTVDLYETMTNIVTKAEAEVRMPMQEAIPVEVSFSFIGLTEEQFNTYVEESIVYESMISPANQSICLIKVNDSSKVAELKKAIFDNSNLRKWVCMSAERGVVIDSGNYILLAMAENAKCDNIIKAFSEEFGGNVGEVLSKMGE